MRGGGDPHHADAEAAGLIPAATRTTGLVRLPHEASPFESLAKPRIGRSGVTLCVSDHSKWCERGAKGRTRANMGVKRPVRFGHPHHFLETQNGQNVGVSLKILRKAGELTS